MLELPTYEDVVAASRRLEGQAHRTPVLRSATADRLAGAELFFKCENFQRMGAFKFRGAYNALSKFSSAQRKAGVIAFSSGNHAQAIALSAKLLGIPAAILMPFDAPQAKIDATRGYGGEVILFDRYTQDREALTAQLADRTRHDPDPSFQSPGCDGGAGHRGQGTARGSGRTRRDAGAAWRRRAAQRHRPGDAGAVAALQALRRGARGGQRCAAVAARRPHRQHTHAANARRRRPDPASG